jgi:hypothetical protein
MATLGANALTTQQQVKDRLDIDGSFAITLINAASNFIEKYCSRQFQFVTGIVENHAGFGLDKLVLRRPPIVGAITSLTFDGSDVDLSDINIINPNAGIVQRVGGFLNTAHNEPDISRTTLPGTEREQYQFTYDGGFVLPNDAGTTTLPEEIELGCLAMIAFLNASLGRDPTIKSEKLMSWGATYRDDMDVPPAAEMLLKPYKRIVV